MMNSQRIIFFMMCAILLTVVGCGRQESSVKGSTSVEELLRQVEKSFREKDGNSYLQLMTMEDVPSEIQGALSVMVEGWGNIEYDTIERNVYDYESYEPIGDLPGVFNGKELEWNTQPRKWLVLKVARADDESFDGTFEMAAASEGGKWFICGVVYK